MIRLGRIKSSVVPEYFQPDPAVPLQLVDLIEVTNGEVEVMERQIIVRQHAEELHTVP